MTAPLTGYADRISVRAGEKIAFKVSSAGPGPYHAMLVRIIRSDPNPGGLPTKLEDQSELFDGRFASRQQHAWPGSYALIDGAKDVKLAGALAVEALIWPTLPEDGPQTVISRRDPEQGTGEGGAGFALVLTPDGMALESGGARVVVCKPADPEAKGMIERAHDYLERSFLPGRAFAGPADFNAQLAAWLALVNTRPRRALGCSPAQRITADKAAMLTLPPGAPQTGWRAQSRLPRDHYVRLGSNDYSVHPAAIGRRIEVTAGLDRVQVWCGGQLAADHERAWAWHQVITDPEHKAAAAGLRRQRVGVLRPAPEPEVEQRSLDVYDALTGGDGGAA